MPLSELQVRSAKPRVKVSKLSDGDGLQLWVTPDGAKRWRLAAHGIDYQPAEMNRNELFLSFLPLVNARRAALLDNERLIVQFAHLERSTTRGGRDTVDHPRGAPNDVANAVAGALSAVADFDQAPMKISPLVMQEVRARARWAADARTAGVDPHAYRRRFPIETTAPKTIGAMYLGRGGRRSFRSTPQYGESRNDY